MSATSDASAIPRPRLRAVGLNAEFYQRCASGTLHFQRCLACGSWRHLPRPMCAACGSTDWEWSPSSGHGRIFSWTVTHRSAHPAFAAQVPYAVAVVEMEEEPGVRLVARLRDLPPERIELGLPLEVGFEKVSDELALPFFRPRRRA